MDPAQALEEIAILLEAGGAPTAKVTAFRRAHAVVAELEPADLARLAAAGRLTSLPGIGASTSKVVAQALAGEVPTYLRDLLDAAPAKPEAGAALRAALRGDCHIHSTWSDGGSSILDMARQARRLGHAYLVVTDHSPRLRVANGLSPERLRAQRVEIAAVNARLTDEPGEPLRVLAGIEVDITVDGGLDQTDELLEASDVVVASVHSDLRASSAAMTRRMLSAIATGRMDVLGHCTGRRVVAPMRPPSTFDAEAVFAACAQADVAVEINSRPERKDPPRELLRQAVAAGCEFTIDTDAHAPGQLEWQWIGCERASECGVSAERVWNTLAVDDLLARVQARRG